MHIIVTVKQVPDPEAPQQSFSVDREARRVVVAPSVPTVVNDLDVYATEAAVRIKDNEPDTSISILSLGQSHVMEVVRRPVAMGADNLYLVQEQETDAPPSDAVSTAHALSAAIKRIGPFDLVLCGRQSADLDQGVVASGIAWSLGIPCLTNAKRVHCRDGWVQIDRSVEGGVETVEARLPALVTVSNELGTPRFATMRGVMQAQRVQPVIWSKEDLEPEAPVPNAGSRLTSVEDLFLPEKEGQVEMIEAETPEDAARQLAHRLRADKLI